MLVCDVFTGSWRTNEEILDTIQSYILVERDRASVVLNLDIPDESRLFVFISLNCLFKISTMRAPLSHHFMIFSFFRLDLASSLALSSHISHLTRQWKDFPSPLHERGKGCGNSIGRSDKKMRRR